MKNTKNTSRNKLLKIFDQHLALYRRKLSNDFLPSAIILVEGLTEQILLPYFALTYGLDLLQLGAILIPAGGSNKIVRKYDRWKKVVDLPIICLFDADAVNLANILSPNLRDTDSVLVLNGEIEDLMRLDFLVESINHYLEDDLLYNRSQPVLESDFAPDERRTIVLDKIWRKNELGKFEKVKFAQFIVSQADNINREIITTAAKNIFDKLETTLVAKTHESTK